MSVIEAALGAEIDVPLLDGGCAWGAGRHPGGAVFRMRGKGFPLRRAARGDAHVRVAVETPAAVSDEAKRAAGEAGRALADEALPRRRAFRDGRAARRSREEP